MKGTVKIFFLILFLFNVSLYSQLLTEEFNYTSGQAITANGWTAYSAPGNNPILVVSGSLSYPGYPSSGIGNSAQIIGTSTSSEDDKKTFTGQTSGSVYASFLVNFSSATTATDGDYFFGFFTSTGTTMRGRVYIKRSGSNIAFGISKAGTVPILTSFSYSLNTTYLLVLKYIFNVSSSNDVIQLFVNPDLSGSEPSPTLTNIDVATDLSNIGAIALRQGKNAYNLTIDGVRVAISWSQAPLPVELSSFSAAIISNGVKLNWRTETEVNNYGFELERKAPLNPPEGGRNGGWDKIGFVEGHGNSNSPKEYSFVDNNVSSGRYAYRLKQIDNDGSFEYSKIVEIDLGLPLQYELSQNYPNPFNPSTTIKYQIPKAGNVKLTVFNLLGEVVSVLVDKYEEAGVYSLNLNASALKSGIYFYKLESAKFIQVKKMSLIR